MKYNVIRTETADEQIREIILYIAEKFGNEVALDKLSQLEKGINNLRDNPRMGIDPHYRLLKRQGFKVLIVEKNLVFYKINNEQKEIIIYAVVDQRQDYINIVRGL